MTRAFLSLIVLYFVTSCTSPQGNADCSKFKVGKFRYHAKESGNSYIIERKDSTQIETNLNTGSITTLRINWINPCEYELRYVARKNSPNDTLMSIVTTTVLKTKIIEVGKDYCIFSSQAVGFERILIDTLKL